MYEGNINDFLLRVTYNSPKSNVSLIVFPGIKMNEICFGKSMHASSSLKSESLNSSCSFGRKVVIFTSFGNTEMPPLTRKLCHVYIMFCD